MYLSSNSIKRLKSNFSHSEKDFFLIGKQITGTGNALTSLFKFIGYYNLMEENFPPLIRYSPDADEYFKYENYGYTVMNSYLRSIGINLSRKCLKSLSRKWPGQPVRINYETDKIIKEIFRYISKYPELKNVCIDYMQNFVNWYDIIEIQYTFLGVRRAGYLKTSPIADQIVSNLIKFKKEELL